MELVANDKGYLTDFEGKPVLASCTNCTHCEDVSDGPEYSNHPYYICHKRPHMSNLKGFPFKSPQSCCELHCSFMVDWDEEARKAGYSQ